jgi:Condensation domain
MSALLRVPFGGPSREGPLTMAQANMLRSMLELRSSDDPYTMNLWLNVAVPGGTGLDGIGAALTALLGRHEVLRSRFSLDGEPRQCVTGAGTLPVEVREAGATMAETVQRLRAALFGTHFDVAGELPLRAAVVTRDGDPARLLLALSHLACDQGSLEVLRRDLAALLRDGTAPPPAHPTRQPIDQAERERTPAALARSRAALDFWCATVAAAPQAMFAVPLAPAQAEPFAQARMCSPALALAAAAVAARTRTSPATALLAATAALVGLRTGNDRCLIAAPTANRFLPELLDFLGPLAQDALLDMALDGGTFDDLVRRARSATLAGYRHSQYDAARLWPALDAIGLARGTRYARDTVVNNVSPPVTGPVRPCSAQRLAEALRETELFWTEAEDLPARFVLVVHRLEGTADLTLWASTRHLPRPEIAAFLGGIERLLVAAATAAVPLAELSTVAGVAPPSRGGDWLLVDRCWVRPPDCRAVLAGLPAVRDAAVFASPDPDLGYRLTGYLVPAGGGPVDLVRLHRECVAALPGNESAMAPHRYVVCASAPEVGRDPGRGRQRPEDEAGWRAMPVLAQGTGRAA